MQLPKYHKRKEFSLLHNCILSYGGKAAHVIVPNSKSAGGLRDFMLRKANKNNNTLKHRIELCAYTSC